MHLIYSKDGSPVDGLAGHYRNPDYFRECEQGVTQVAVDAAFPHIAEAYQALGIEVVLLDTEVVLLDAEPDGADQPRKPGKGQKGKKSEAPDETPQVNPDETDAG